MFLVVSAIFAFTFGAVIGSFLNVVIHRLPREESVVSPPSHCPSCQEPIRWYDNVPIISWLVLGGECRHCDASISARYAAVEGLTGVLSVMLWLKLVVPQLDGVAHWAMLDWPALLAPFFLYFTFIGLCVALAFIDLEHLIVPHELAIPGILIGLASPWVMHALYTPREMIEQWPPISPTTSLIGAIAGAVSVLIIFVVYFVLRGIAGMGGGDVTLMAMVGAWLGWPALIFVFFAASIQGLIATAISFYTGSSLIHDANVIFEEDAASGAGPPGADGALEGQDAEGPEDDEARAVGGDDDADADAEDVQEEETEDEDEDQDQELEPEEGTHVEIIEGEEEAGPMAIPFGPFIVLSALEHLFLGPLLPDGLSMFVMYL